MDQQLKKIDSFLKQEQCIFDFDIIDYPTEWQQDFLNSFFFVNKIMEKQHTQIVRQLHSSSQKTLKTIAQGFLYSSLISLQLFKQYTQYMIILRVEFWIMMSYNLQILIQKHLGTVKPKYLLNLADIYNLLVSYSLAEPQLTRLYIQSINQHEKNPQRINSFIKILKCFENIIISEDGLANKQMAKCFYHTLFLKCIRTATLPIFSQTSQSILMKLWQQNQIECSEFISNNLIAFESQYSKRDPISQKIYNSLLAKKRNIRQKPDYREIVYGCLLPKNIQSLLQYILLAQNIDFSNIRLQLTWLEKQWSHDQNQFYRILIDISVWVSLNYDNISRRGFIIEWAIRKVFYQSQGIYQLIRKFIFQQWFKFSQNQQYKITSIYLLRQIMYNEHRVANQIFTYILKNKQQFGQRIKSTFLFANRRGFLKFDEINLCENLSIAVKQAFRSLFQGHVTEIQNNYQIAQEPPLLRNRSESINYDTPNAISIPTKINQDSITLQLQEEFTIRIGQQLNNLLDEPNIENFKKFFKKICQQGVTCRKQDDIEQLNKICEESSKVIFIMFNHEFQEFGPLQNKEQSVIYLLLQFVVLQWHRVTHKLQIYKQVIKTLITYFPSGQVAFWRYFFQFFQYGGKNNRGVKNWLVSSEQSVYVGQVIQSLCGKIDENMKKNMHAYGLKPI